MKSLWKRNENAQPEQEQRERLIAYQRVFGTADGKTVLHDLMNRFYVLNSHGGDAFKEGQRATVISIMNNCNISIEAFDQMLKGDYE